MEDNDNILKIVVTNPGKDERDDKITKVHNGYLIDEIKRCYSSKFFITHSRKDKSIFGWIVDHNQATIQDYINYSEEDFFVESERSKKPEESDKILNITIDDVSQSKYIILYNY